MFYLYFYGCSLQLKTTNTHSHSTRTASVDSGIHLGTYSETERGAYFKHGFLISSKCIPFVFLHVADAIHVHMYTLRYSRTTGYALVNTPWIPGPPTLCTGTKLVESPKLSCVLLFDLSAYPHSLLLPLSTTSLRLIMRAN